MLKGNNKNMAKSYKKAAKVLDDRISSNRITTEEKIGVFNDYVDNNYLRLGFGTKNYLKFAEGMLYAQNLGILDLSLSLTLFLRYKVPMTSKSQELVDVAKAYKEKQDVYGQLKNQIDGKKQKSAKLKQSERLSANIQYHILQELMDLNRYLRERDIRKEMNEIKEDEEEDEYHDTKGDIFKLFEKIKNKKE